MSQTKPTPTPWEISENVANAQFTNIVNKNGKRVACCREKADAEQVVRLANHHAELLKAAKAAERFLRMFEGDWNEITDEQHGKWGGMKHAKALAAVIAKVGRQL